jgi:hypothetical protein
MSALVIRCNLWSPTVVSSDESADQAEDETYKTDRYNGGLYYGDSAMTDHRYFTRCLATKDIAPGPVETCGIWPFGEKDTNFPEFIIGEDEHGKPVMFRCDPDLPSAERDYWRGFMIARDAKISETNLRRSFLNQFADSSALDLQFRRLYERANQAWAARYGWPLFREPKEPDTFMLQQAPVSWWQQQNR